MLDLQRHSAGVFARKLFNLLGHFGGDPRTDRPTALLIGGLHANTLRLFSFHAIKKLLTKRLRCVECLRVRQKEQMNTILTTYIEHPTATRLAEEARRLGLSKSEFIARVLRDRRAWGRVAAQVKQERKLQPVAA